MDNEQIEEVETDPLTDFQNEVWKGLEKYSNKLGWGIGGHQPECWSCLDMAVDELKARREKSALIVRVIERISCGCISMDCTHHGAYIPGDLDVLRDIIKKKSLL